MYSIKEQGGELEEIEEQFDAFSKQILGPKTGPRGAVLLSNKDMANGLLALTEFVQSSGRW